MQIIRVAQAQAAHPQVVTRKVLVTSVGDSLPFVYHISQLTDNSSQIANNRAVSPTLDFWHQNFPRPQDDELNCPYVYPIRDGTEARALGVA